MKRLMLFLSGGAAHRDGRGGGDADRDHAPRALRGGSLVPMSALGFPKVAGLALPERPAPECVARVRQAAAQRIVDRATAASW